jgi:hypothetical protein
VSPTSRRPNLVLPLADAAALIVFALAGLASHDGALATGFARTALPLLVGWFAVALAVGTYRRGSARAFLVTWSLGIPLGVGIRAIALGRELGGDQAAFLGVTLVVTLALLAAARLLVSLGRQLAAGTTP